MAKVRSQQQLYGPSLEHEIYRRARMVFRDEILSIVGNFEEGDFGIS